MNSKNNYLEVRNNKGKRSVAVYLRRKQNSNVFSKFLKDLTILRLKHKNKLNLRSPYPFDITQEQLAQTQYVIFFIQNKLRAIRTVNFRSSCFPFLRVNPKKTISHSLHSLWREIRAIFTCFIPVSRATACTFFSLEKSHFSSSSMRHVFINPTLYHCLLFRSLAAIITLWVVLFRFYSSFPLSVQPKTTLVRFYNTIRVRMRNWSTKWAYRSRLLCIVEGIECWRL